MTTRGMRFVAVAATMFAVALAASAEKKVERSALPKGSALMLSVVDAAGKLPRFDEPVRVAARRMSDGMQPISRAVSHVILMDGLLVGNAA